MAPSGSRASKGTFTGPDRRRPSDPDATTGRLAALTDATARMMHATTIEQVAGIAVRAGVEAVGADGGTVAVLDGTGVLRLSSTDHYNPDLVRELPWLPLDAALPIAHTARTGERLLLPDRASALDRFPEVAAHQSLTDLAGTPIVSAAVLPLRVDGAVLGSLTMTWARDRTFDRADVDLLDALAALVAQAVHRVQSTTVRDRALEHASLLAAAGASFVGRDPQGIVSALRELLAPAYGEGTSVHLFGRGPAHGPSAPGSDGSTGLSRQQPPTEVPARCSVALQAEGRRLGTLAVERYGPAYSVEEVQVLTALAERAAAALDMALALEEQRETSMALQRALLTDPPEPDHLHIVVRYLPATHTAVGGDCYDAILTPDGATVLVIGDVVGHDAGAAASMGQLRGLLRTLAYTGGQGPAALLAQVEDTARGLSVSALATALVGRLERHPDRARGQRTLRWSNAGHPPPVLVHADGTTDLLMADPDVMLGVAAGLPRSEHQCDLADGDTLLLYTDGLIERRDSDLDEGLARLRAAIGELASAGPDTLCDALLERLLPQGTQDDVALLAVRLNP